MKHGKLFYSHHVAVRDGLDLVDVELVHPLVHDAVERVEELDDLEGGAALGDHGEVDDRVEVDGGGLEAVGDVLSSGGGGVKMSLDQMSRTKWRYLPRVHLLHHGLGQHPVDELGLLPLLFLHGDGLGLDAGGEDLSVET